MHSFCGRLQRSVRKSQTNLMGLQLKLTLLSKLTNSWWRQCSLFCGVVAVGIWNRSVRPCACSLKQASDAVLQSTKSEPVLHDCSKLQSASLASFRSKWNSWCRRCRVCVEVALALGSFQQHTAC